MNAATPRAAKATRGFAALQVALQDVLVSGDRVEERHEARVVEVDRVRRPSHDVESRALLGAL